MFYISQQKIFNNEVQSLDSVGLGVGRNKTVTMTQKTTKVIKKYLN